MRLRRNPEAKQMILNHPQVVLDPTQLRGSWRSLFGNDHPLYLELGTGKGQFLSRAHNQYPDINWIGVERIEEVLLQALQKSNPLEHPPSSIHNLRFLWMDVKDLGEAFDPGEVDRIHLHFSDPWPKKRHQKRRLTYRSFLAIYRQVLKQDGYLQLKTDNEHLFDFSLEELPNHGFHIVEQTRDLYETPLVKENIPTEYEEKFTAQGMPIYFLRAQPR
ncbi:tRNA (guanosine(46)-N7)-methyltransferase TrmB [Marininema halotolerans]|uniref:tRNA (guanine-N(7)-)-methyltransferase n=1 Tax=Marininema halotolerans TaxID=1155944 RepID=A0A1I6PUF3_9BACL|nr:tRNA (guanosine(46)-N7)-methyltransferase TrmB [Marininema halotolerans]SFS43843.1 tRNA (guanine-N7-)-methyltransferase [Marininema halotolerans]